MTSSILTYHEPEPELRRREIGAGDARVAVITRTYPTSVEDLWDACTSPDRLARWYTNVAGDLRVGGTFTQELMGSGEIVACDAPRFLKLSLGADEIEVRIAPGVEDGTATLEIQHATTRAEHEVDGQVYDAIYCMGGGYYPRLLALDRHLRGDLPDSYDSTTFFLDPAMRPTIDRGSAAMQGLLDADADAA